MIQVIIKDIDETGKIKKAVKNADGYCPCKLIKCDETKCICKHFLDEIRKKINEENTVDATINCSCKLYSAHIIKTAD